MVPAGADLPPRGAEVPPPGAEVPPDEVLKAPHIVNVEGMGYMRATQGPNGTIVMVSVDLVTNASKWSHYHILNGPITTSLMVPLSHP